jgi:hypothetical protein
MILFVFYLSFLKTYVKRTRILCVMLLPAAAVKQKAKEGLERLGRGIVLPFCKTQPVCFWFLCAVGLRRLP